MREQRTIIQNIDWPTLLVYLILITMGWFNIYAAVYNEEHKSLFSLDMQYGKQFMWIGISLAVAMVILFTDGKFFPTLAFFIYGFMVLLLIATIFIGAEIKGSHSWIRLGSFSIQPAELSKFAVCLALARYLGEINVRMEKLQTRLISAAIIIVPMLIILLQNETGLAIVYASFIFVLYREGLPGWFLLLGFGIGLLFVLSLVVAKTYLFASIGAVAVLAFLFVVKKRNFSSMVRVLAVAGMAIAFTFSVNYIFTKVLKPHQRIRIDALLGNIDESNRKIAEKGILYNVNQSKIAIGSGGVLGKGYLKGTQTKYDFVPEQDTDFIFCTVGEEWGFVGTSTVIGLFLFLILRIIYIAERQKAPFTRIYGYGVASILFFHLTVNIGMTLGLMPVIGIPLPFFSYGGSSLLGFTILLFILIRLDSYRMQTL